MPKRGKRLYFPKKLYARTILQMPKGTTVRLCWYDKWLGHIYSEYILIGNGLMQSKTNPELIIRIEDLPGKYYAEVKDEQSNIQTAGETQKETAGDNQQAPETDAE